LRFRAPLLFEDSVRQFQIVVVVAFGDF
jgi:hypothetical protein